MSFLDGWRLQFLDCTEEAPYHLVLRAIAGLSSYSAYAFSYYAALTQLGLSAPAPHADVVHAVELARQVPNQGALAELLEHVRAAASYGEIAELICALAPLPDAKPSRSKSDLDSHMKLKDTDLFAFAVANPMFGEANVASPIVPQQELLASTAESPLKVPLAQQQHATELVMSEYEDLIFYDDDMQTVL